MLNLEITTLYHRGWDEVQGIDTYSKTEYPAHWYEHTVTSVQADGLQYAKECKIRIPFSETLEIAATDRVLRGSSDSPTPPKSALEVIGYSDNRKGINPHWLVMAK